METITKAEISKETKFLEEKYKELSKVNGKFRRILAKRGYTFCELGSSRLSYTCSGDVGEKYFANDKRKYFGIGVYNIAQGKYSNGIGCICYRAFIKEIVE